MGGNGAVYWYVSTNWRKISYRVAFCTWPHHFRNGWLVGKCSRLMRGMARWPAVLSLSPNINDDEMPCLSISNVYLMKNRSNAPHK